MIDFVGTKILKNSKNAQTGRKRRCLVDLKSVIPVMTIQLITVINVDKGHTERL